MRGVSGNFKEFIFHWYRFWPVLEPLSTVKPPIKDTPKEDKPPNKGQAESTLVYTLYKKNHLNLSTNDKTAGPEGVLIKSFTAV